MKRSRRVLATLMLVTFIATACSDTDDGGGGGGGGTIVIGNVADFSDVYSYYDQPYLDGAQFAVDEINAAGGILNRQVEIVFRDNENDLALGARMAQEVLDEGIVYMIGTSSDAGVAQAQVVCAEGIPVSTGYSSAPAIVADMGECGFQTVYADNVGGAGIAEYARDQGYETAYLLASPEIPYTANLPLYFGEAFEQGGGKVVGEGEFRIDAGDYSAQVTEISNLDPQPDVIFTSMFLPDTPVFLRQLRQAGVTTPVLGGDGNHDTALLDAGADVLDGFVFNTHGFPEPGTPFGEFFEKYTSETGNEPTSIVEGVGYDDIYFLKAAIEKADSTEPAAIIAAMETVQIDGVTGTMKFDPETHRLVGQPVVLVRLDGAEMALEGTVTPQFVPDPDV
ncbi:MAG: ABC transporter substrate-binding protein [Gemmatimonadota bacterium]